MNDLNRETTAPQSSSEGANDPCPRCGIHRQHQAGNPDACGPGYGQIGCFLVAYHPAGEPCEFCGDGPCPHGCLDDDEEATDAVDA